MVNDNATPPGDVNAYFQTGNRGLMVLLGQRYLVAIQSVARDTVTVSFPVQDFPVDGMHVDIEFHDKDGCIRFETEVLKGPQGPGDGVVLRIPAEAQQVQHRTRWRISADFEARIKDHVHPRVHQVPVVNVSAGGMLIRTMVDLKVGDDLDVAFTLPDGSAIRTVAQTVHVAGPEEVMGSRASLVGLRFIGLGESEQRTLTNYVWQRIRALGPDGQLRLRRKTDDAALQASQQ